jgi:SOS regulatory protein LexA
MSIDHKQILSRFYKTYRRMPSYAEMMKLFEYRSKNAVFRVVQKLIDEGVVEKDSTGKLVPLRLSHEVPLLGVVEAGFPSAAEEEMLDALSIDEYLVEKPNATYLLRVKGDSMKDAGIMEGDLVLVERTEGGKVGDIVVAEIDGQWTMKYLRKKGSRFYLEAANDKYPDMYPEEDLNVVAIVKGIIRKY